MDTVSDWLQSNQTVRICSLDLKPIPHGVFTDRAQCVVKGQAAVFFLQQVPQANIWLLKIFTPARRPTDDYLKAVGNYLPGGAEFFTCTQRRLLSKDHLDLRNSTYRNPSLPSLIDGAIMMPKVPGTTWASIADDLRDGRLVLSTVQRLQIGINLAECILMLEAGQCCHRDLSSTNVFFDKDGRAYLIDWDCLYHPQLPFQPNTTIGTMGYVAPFINITGGDANAALSWCAGADRFALAILIAEILLVGSDSPAPHEDGALFSQAQINSKDDDFVFEQIEELKMMSKSCAALLERALASSGFSECPSPGNWISALKYTIRRQGNCERAHLQNTRCTQYVRVACGECGAVFKIAESKHEKLKSQDKAILCRSCFEIQLKKWSAGKAERNTAFPQVCCEYCKTYFRLQREKLDTLLDNGKPILCSFCLAKQLRQWQAEHAKYKKDYPQIKCAECGKSFRLRKEKLDSLQSRCKAVFCRDCLGIKLESNTGPNATSSSQTPSFGSSLWKSFGRIINGYFA